MTKETNDIEVRKSDASTSTRDFWRNGAGDGVYHRHDDPCEGAPESGYVHYMASIISNPKAHEFCSECDWTHTTVAEYVGDT